MPNHRRLILTAFKKRGLSISPKALTALLNILKHQPQQDVNSILHDILDEIKGRLMDRSNHHHNRRSSSSGSGGGSLVVSVELMEEVVADMTRDGKDVMEEAMQLVDLDSGMPKIHFDFMKKRFHLQPSNRQNGGGVGGFFGSVDDKVEMLLQRYALIHQRLMRNPHFKPRLVQSSHITSRGGEDDDDDDDDDGVRKITPIEGLLGSTSGDKILLGIIVEVEEGRYYLEDPTAQIEMDFSHADFEFLSAGYVTEHSICLVEGEMVDGVLSVKKIGHPLSETRKEAMDAIGLQNSDVFGAIPTLSELGRLQKEEENHWEDGMFVILSDVHLDDGKVLEKLERLFEGFGDHDVLPVFIFFGDFASRYPSAVTENAHATMMGYFDDLASVITKFPRVAEEGRFVLVPGQNDPGIGSILPRPKIPDYFTAGLRSKVKNVHMASNPCRLRYFSKEFVLGRIDVLTKLRRSAILSPNISQDNVEEAQHDQDDSVDGDDDHGLDSSKNNDSNPRVKHAIKTMMDQGHLCPVPPSSLPIYWNYDHLMRLYPPPSAVILGDKSSERHFETYNDCDFLNPGPFYSDYGFLVFRPMDMDSTGVMKSDVEFSFVP